MKKLFIAMALFFFAHYAQAQRIELENVMISSVKVKEGTNSIPIPGNKGTIKIVKRSGKIVSAIVLDSLGKTHTLTSTPAGTNGAPKPACKYPLPDACFGGPQNIGLCMCKPTDLTTGDPDEVNIALLLPAVQKVREAAARMQ